MEVYVVESPCERVRNSEHCKTKLFLPPWLYAQQVILYHEGYVYEWNSSLQSKLWKLSVRRVPWWNCKPLHTRIHTVMFRRWLPRTTWSIKTFPKHKLCLNCSSHLTVHAVLTVCSCSSFNTIQFNGHILRTLAILSIEKMCWGEHANMQQQCWFSQQTVNNVHQCVSMLAFWTEVHTCQSLFFACV